MRSFLRLRFGELGCVFSRVNSSRHSMSPHSKHSRVWCSKPGTGMVSSCTTCVTYISAAHTKHRIATAPFQWGVRRTDASCGLFDEVRVRVASKQAAPPLSHVNSAVRTLKPHQVGPDAGQGRIVNVKLKINRLSGLWAATNEIAHRLTANPQEKEGNFLAAFLPLGRPHRAS